MDTAVSTPVKSKKVTKGAKKVQKSKTHPKYMDMVIEAVKFLKERNGSSRQAILKFVNSKYDVGKEAKANTHIKNGLKRAITTGVLKHAKGHGASGSFKLSVPVNGSPKTSTSKAVASKATASPKAKKTAAAKPTKAAAKKSPKAKAPAKAKSPPKAKKASPKKAVTPKAKKAAPKKAKAAAKASPKPAPVKKVTPPKRKAPTVRKPVAAKKAKSPKKSKK